MTGLLRAVALDHRIMRPRYRVLLLLLAIGLAVGGIGGTPLTTIILVTLITAPIGGSYFAVYETNRLDHLYGTLPLRRAVAEAGIYLHTIILVAVNGLLAALLAWRVAVAQHDSVTIAEIAVTFSLALLAASLYIGLLFPVYLAVPFTKVYILTNVPFYGAAVVLVYLVKRTHWLDGLASVVDFYRAYPGWGSALSITVGLALLALSWGIAQAAGIARRR
jgi:hypothetical protein